MLKDGDANTAFYHRQCLYRRHKNCIYSISTLDRILTDAFDMAQAAFSHFDGLLGTAVIQDRMLNLEQLIDTLGGLENLEEPFTEVEIWNTIKRLPGCKALGPDGFMVEFLHACWGIVKQDFMTLFQQLYDLQG
jgi:hypothetical protein